ncbi:MAG: TetR/AcrR family transcriptional regulator [Gaiellaceae bacterium MAG52_C11]|nr:TetR/AcrR family transcriptional regulator [Candidatus Gaiellasilicea maunaloa]
MPRISEEARNRRRDEILEAARGCFAAYGYEKATVVRLEQATGLSRGAIFNYFPSKDELFLALAERDANRLGRLWADEGLDAVVRALVGEDPAWLGAYLEVGRRLRTDAAFRERWDRRAPEVEEEIKARLERARDAGEIRDDISLDAIGRFIGLVVDGLAMRLAAGFPPPDATEILQLVGDAIRGPASGEPARSRAHPCRPA